MNGRRHLAIVLAAVLSVAACAGSVPTLAPTLAPVVATATATAVATAAVTPGPTLAPAPTPTIAPTLAVNPAPPDLPFTIDCSAMPSERQQDCDAYLATNRDRVYPILRQMTGVDLSKCYKTIRYAILPTDPAPGAGGTSSGPVITYNAQYSIDSRYPYDLHELLHSASDCSRALDLHLFHGFFRNVGFDMLGAHEASWFYGKLTGDFRIQLEQAIVDSRTASGTALFDVCRNALTIKIAFAYLDVGVASFRPLYRSTIPPVKILAQPSATMTAVWGKYAGQVEALNETLRNELNYPLDDPSCGFSAA
jgi:hypothetical protein